MLAVEVLVQAVVIPRTVPKEERCRPRLPRGVAAFQVSRMVGRVALRSSTRMGRHPVTHVLDDTNYRVALLAKLHEETGKAQQAKRSAR